MVAVIKTGHSIHRILNYNENKVKEGMAVCISAGNYPIEVEKLGFNQKLNRLVRQAALNENVTRNSVHVSLNFDPSEKLSTEQLKEIADVYMQKIGFGEQPYLVYQHFDAGHPHIHSVSVKVRANGSRIDTHNIGCNQSEKARKEIEQSFGLVRAEDSKQKEVFELKPVNVQKVQYGRSETKRAITNVLDAVLNTYKYSSLPELNAILQQYNVIAERGGEDSRIYQNKGLVYRILDGNGDKVGVPLKASDFYNKPTLMFLEGKFQQNEELKHPYKSRIKNAIDVAFLKQVNLSVEGLIKELQKEGIQTVLRQNAEGILYGITYLDQRTKCVFNGSSLGKQYSAKAIQERCGKVVAENQQPALEPSHIVPTQHSLKPSLQSEAEAFSPSPGVTNLLDTLLQPENTAGSIPHQLKGKKKKKKRNIHL